MKVEQLKITKDKRDLNIEFPAEMWCNVYQIDVAPLVEHCLLFAENDAGTIYAYADCGEVYFYSPSEGDHGIVNIESEKLEALLDQFRNFEG